jgi:hypothetical protein
MPDPMVMNDGRRVKTVKQWRARREEIRRVLEYYATGLMPPAPGNVVGREIKSASVLGGKVDYRLVHLSFGPRGKLGFDVAIFTPADQKGPFATIVNPAFDATPGAEPLPLLPRLRVQGRGRDALTLPLGIPARTAKDKPAPPVEPEAAAEKYSELFRRGYALVTWHYEDCGEDAIARNSDGSWAFRDTRFFPAYPGRDWGLLAAWAWGMSRCVDWLETQPFVDKDKLIVVGHSRIGKAVLVAGAFDERIALTAPAGSAGGGVGAYRFSGAGRGGQEGLDDMAHKFPNWFAPHYRQFLGQTDKLPYDQHWLVALVAPRAFVVLDGTQDICLPNAVRQTLRGARPVYALYGATDRLGVNYENHKHGLMPEDWRGLMDFADWQLRGMKPARRFDRYPPEPAAGTNATAKP